MESKPGKIIPVDHDEIGGIGWTASALSWETPQLLVMRKLDQAREAREARFMPVKAKAPKVKQSWGARIRRWVTGIPEEGP